MIKGIKKEKHLLLDSLEDLLILYLNTIQHNIFTDLQLYRNTIRVSNLTSKQNKK